MRKLMIVSLAFLFAGLFNPRLPAQDRSEGRSIQSRLASVERELEALLALAEKEGSPQMEDVARLLEETRALRNSMPRPVTHDEMILVEMRFLEFEDGTDKFFFARGAKALKLLDPQDLESLVSRPNFAGKSVQGLKPLTTEELELLASRASNVIAAPRVLVFAGHEAAMDMVDEQGYAVLERDDDGRYSMHTVKAKEGINVKLTASYQHPGEPAPPNARVMAGDDGSDRMAPIHLHVAAAIERVVGRSPCTKDARQVGMPLIGKAAREMDMVIARDQWVAIRLPLPGSKKGGIVLALRAKAVK